MNTYGRTVPALVALVVATGLAPAAAATADPVSVPVVAQSLLDRSPSDDQLRGLTGVQLAAVAVRCAEFDGSTYCLHLGWEESTPTAEELAARVLAAQEPDLGDGVAEPSLAAGLAEWAAKPFADRFAEEQAELREALEALGKVRYFAYAADEQELPADFHQKYPEVAQWETAPPDEPVERAAGVRNVIAASRTMKQPNGYYCGPTTMAIMAWNDPSGDRGHSTSTWASRLGTTRNGTSITNMVRVTNRHLTWDNRVGAYVTLSIARYTNTQFRNVYKRHIDRGAPVILHPRWTANLNPFGRTTGGHFDVGAGYDFSSGRDLINIAEPAWSGTPNMFKTSTANVLTAQKQNTAFKNIGV
ncbi:C39 family peptidase [Umezawaea beigongshangensis]|uniref:C39 family peptidase n=1 Tax=Umezawaea beigongshangensis TaxID=2780383 RepID=UPI0018F260E2|nr:C39 family peptidase [Umezawaea beigongshangensis]